MRLGLGTAGDVPLKYPSTGYWFVYPVLVCVPGPLVRVTMQHRREAYTAAVNTDNVRRITGLKKEAKEHPIVQKGSRTCKPID